MDEFVIQMTREGYIFPQSPDEDLASRLAVKAGRCLAAGGRLAATAPEEAILLFYLSVYHFGRGLLAAQGYRVSDKDPHRAVFLMVSHLLKNAGPAAADYKNVYDHWVAVVHEPDMPIPALNARRARVQTERVLGLLRKRLVAEFPLFKTLFRPQKKKPLTVSPERTFRD